MKELAQIADQLNNRSNKLNINKKELEESIDTLFHNVLFPVCSNEGCTSGKYIYIVYSILLDNLTNLLDRNKATEITYKFIHKLPNLQARLTKEAENFLNNDPASGSLEEVILTYPGFYALVIHRIAHELHNLGAPIIPRLFSEYAHSKVGVDIHPAAKIGELFYIDHGTGLVIGETTVIGKNVKVYQGVTLGASFVTKKLKGTKRHPSIEDNVVIYAGATILGGKTVVGRDSIIGGSVWLTESVKPNSVVYHEAKVKIKNANDK